MGLAIKDLYQHSSIVSLCYTRSSLCLNFTLKVLSAASDSENRGAGNWGVEDGHLDSPFHPQKTQLHRWPRKTQSTGSTPANQVITTVQLLSLHSKTNNYLKCFGLFRLNYHDTNNYLTNINGLFDWLAYSTRIGWAPFPLQFSSALLFLQTDSINGRVYNMERNFCLLIESTSCSTLSIFFFPFTQMSETKQKNMEDVPVQQSC